MEDELTTKMHEEFKISREDEIELRAGCVWRTWCNNESSKEEVEKYAQMYSISYEDAMKWKEYWLNLCKR